MTCANLDVVVNFEEHQIRSSLGVEDVPSLTELHKYGPFFVGLISRTVTGRSQPGYSEWVYDFGNHLWKHTETVQSQRAVKGLTLGKLRMPVANQHQEGKIYQLKLRQFSKVGLAGFLKILWCVLYLQENASPAFWTAAEIETTLDLTPFAERYHGVNRV